MKRPKQLPAVERKLRASAAMMGIAKLAPQALAHQTLVGKRASPACRAMRDHKCS